MISGHSFIPASDPLLRTVGATPLRNPMGEAT